MPLSMIRLVHQNGKYDDFPVGDISDLQRGTNLTTALNSTIPGDTVIVPASGYKMVNLSRDKVNVYLEEGARIWTDNSTPSPIVVVNSGVHKISGLGTIENLATVASGGVYARGIEVSGGELICDTHKVLSSAPSCGAVVCLGTGRLTLNVKEVRALKYDGLQVEGDGQVLVNAQLIAAEGSVAAGSSNGIEITSGNSSIKRIINAQRVESDLDEAILIQGPSEIVLNCQSVYSKQGVAVHASVGNSVLNIDTSDAGGSKPTVTLFATTGTFGTIKHRGSSHPVEIGVACVLSAERIEGGFTGDGCIKVSSSAATAEPVIDVAFMITNSASTHSIFGDAGSVRNIYLIRDFIDGGAENDPSSHPESRKSATTRHRLSTIDRAGVNRSPATIDAATISVLAPNHT